MKTLALTLATAVSLLLGSSVSADPVAGLPVVAETKNFVYFAKHGKAADAKRCQIFLDEISRLLHQPVAGRAAYYVHERPEDVASASGFSAFAASGITSPSTGDIHTVFAFHRHEIVHRVALELGDPGLFFQEGLAVALGDEGRLGRLRVDELARRSAENGTIGTLVDDFASLDPQTSYAVAGSFVGYLIRTHGVDRVADFFRRCGSNPEERQVHFRRTFGLTLEAAGAAWAAALQS
jgi:hypothetical protein